MLNGYKNKKKKPEVQGNRIKIIGDLEKVRIFES